MLFSHSIMSDSLQPHGVQHTRLPCPSLSPGAYSNSCPLSRWCHPAVSSSVVPFSSCLQSFPSSGSFLMSQLFATGFCHTPLWIRHRYTLSPLPLESPSRHSPLSICLGCHRVLVCVLWVIQQILSIFTNGSVYVSMLLSPSVPLSLSHPVPCIHKSVLYVCISTTALQIGSSVPSF